MWRLKLSKGDDDPWLTSFNNHTGRQFWEFESTPGQKKSNCSLTRLVATRYEVRHSSNLLMRIQFAKKNICEMDLSKVGSGEEVSEERVVVALRGALRFYATLQAEDGHWSGDYAGPLFLLPFLNIDGGWGLHIEGQSGMFCTALNYVSLRLMGEGMDEGDGAMSKDRTWILEHGGATYIPSWGKCFLFVLGVYEWDGNNLTPPELWHLPYILPIHPGRMWCHCRMVYLPISYLFAKRFVGPINAIVLSLRKELYPQPYHLIQWNSVRFQCCKEDMWIDNPNSLAVKRHVSRLKDYLWLAEDGMKMQGYNGSQFWDCVLAVQAIINTNLSSEYGVMLRRAHDFIKRSQMREESLSCWYRHRSKGGWPFSTTDNGWPVSNCTAEGLKTALLLAQVGSDISGEALEAEKLYEAVDLVLSLQNSSGGFASYELTRSYHWLEMINPAETFGDIIIDYQYVECTSAAIQGLKVFKKMHPGYRAKEIERCIDKGVKFIESIQLGDGSWYGNWGVCYTYGTWFGISGLIAGGKTYHNSPSLRKALHFLLSKQLASGGWAESYLSSQNKAK
ncbi:hypothetical protein SASPL_148669 [Salvia splendens]|uniref:Terpene cyclase/mutase family member n=1 Tax=Salvia splendens TaxID=180675 RepID=A0A8X8WB34_SALSN|nr:hypothetical protein SASPL_148669 [Salvia splendens]